MAEVTEVEGTEEEAALVEQSSSWEFVNRQPTSDEVHALLRSLRPVWGLELDDYFDFVQALPSIKKMKVRQGNALVERRFDVYTLYFSVAGRQRMLADAQEKHGWVVHFDPEPKTPTGVPGLISMEDRIIYREYLEVLAPAVELTGKLQVTEGRYVSLGRRPGMAWVPYSGGAQAKGSNPYEKVETAARGRALAAWGFGVLPGSGVASLEEMLGVPQNRAAMDQQASVEQETSRDPAKLIPEVLTLIETFRQKRGASQQAALAGAAEWFSTSTGVMVAVYKGEGSKEIERLDLSHLKPGQLILARNAFAQYIAEAVAAASTD